MSRYTFIACRDDGTTSGSINHGEHVLTRLLQPELIAGLQSLYALDTHGDLGVALWRGWDGEDPIQFVVRHAGHHLAVMDEYGYTYDAHGQRIETEQQEGGVRR